MQTIKNYYHLCVAVLANIIYGFPAKKMIVIGVTGTDGKTTTASLLYDIFSKAGKKVSLLTTVSAYIDGKAYDTGFHVTTPDSLAVQKYLKTAADAGTEYFILETTSHALDQNRVWGIPFRIGVVTNITKEHLDYHKTYENYVHAKTKLFHLAEQAVLNKDDASYALITKEIPDKKIITYGLYKNADVNPTVFPFKTKLLGEFNLYNCLAAITVAEKLGISEENIRKAVGEFTPPVGRQQVVYDKDFQVIVDFAHTPNSFAQILPEVRKITNGRLIHVFGAAGLRDKFKRPMMGRESAKSADIIILTAEDPRTETVESINQQILAGIQNSKFKIQNELEIRNLKFEIDRKYIFQVPNRKEAIELAISLAQKGDTVITTGKSHEKSMNYGQGEEPWDEFAVIEEALKRKHDSNS